MSVTPILVKPQKFGQKQGKGTVPVEERRVEVRVGQKETLREGEEVANWERERPSRAQREITGSSLGEPLGLLAWDETDAHCPDPGCTVWQAKFRLKFNTLLSPVTPEPKALAQ